MGNRTVDERFASRAGVDLGGSLIKIAYFSPEGIQVQLFPATSLGDAIAYLQARGLHHLVLTGGGSVRHRQAFDVFHVETVDEFTANIAGANYLREAEGQVGFPYILVSIGTGTSVYRVTEAGGQRIAGTAVGGGTLLGLGRLLTGEMRYADIVAQAATGDRSLVDVLVRDIYGRDIPGLPGDITASNFGKSLSHRKEDLARALFQMVGEVIATVACLAAQSHQIEEVVYIGASLRENDLLREVLEFSTRFLGKEARFLRLGEFVGAVGALVKGLAP
ncbi:MAG: hypothetical protein ACUVST_06015 [Anaerolineae bacterium]